jgi:hypothetical protein
MEVIYDRFVGDRHGVLRRYPQSAKLRKSGHEAPATYCEDSLTPDTVWEVVANLKRFAKDAIH